MEGGVGWRRGWGSGRRGRVEKGVGQKEVNAMFSSALHG